MRTGLVELLLAHSHAPHALKHSCHPRFLVDLLKELQAVFEQASGGDIVAPAAEREPDIVEGMGNPPGITLLPARGQRRLIPPLGGGSVPFRDRHIAEVIHDRCRNVHGVELPPEGQARFEQLPGLVEITVRGGQHAEVVQATGDPVPVPDLPPECQALLV